MKKYIYILILVLFSPMFFSIFSRDAAVYAYMGTLFFEGKIPYLDGFDHKGITLYLLNGLGYLIGFKHYIGIRILEIGLLFYSFLLIYNSLSKKYTPKIGFIAVVFGLLSLRYFFDGGNLTEEYGAVFVLISLSLLLKKEIKTIDYILIGLLFVVNFTIRANLISFWIALFLAMLFNAIQEKDILKKAILPFSKMAIGIVFFLLFLTAYFLITHSFSEFYNAAFTYNFSYAKQSIGSVLKSIIANTRRYEVSLVLLLGFLITVVSLAKKRINFISLLLLFWVPIELYFSNMSGKLFSHYYMMWVPLIVLSTAYILDYFKIEQLKKEKQWIILGITAFLFFQIPVFNTLSTYKSLVKSKPHKNELIARQINSNYKDASVLIWGNEVSIYNLTHKVAPVSNFYQTLFKLSSPLTKEMIVNFTKQIKEHSPTLIVDVKTPSLLFLDNSNADKINSFQKENLQEYFNFVHQNYMLKETVNGADFYVKK